MAPHFASLYAPPLARHPNLGVEIFFFIAMIFSGIIFILFGLLIISMPELVAYIIAAFIIFIGVNILTMGIMIERNRPKNTEKTFSFMGYEIVKRKK